METSLKKSINEVLETIKSIDKDERVQFVILYGSVSEERQSRSSDIDLAIGYDGDREERFDFRISISGRLPEVFDIQIFQDLPLYVKKEVLGGDVIFFRDKRELYDIAYETVQDYEFFEPLFLDYIRRERS